VRDSGPIEVVFQTRFSFFGQSGWKSKAATDPGLLFEPERLDGRLKYFETITLPSLVDQTNFDFRLMVLSSSLMPEPYQERLRELVNDMLGAERVQLMFQPKGSAGRYLRDAVNTGFADKFVAQTVLDDDDAVAKDFVEMVRHYGALALADDHNPDNYVFLSFARGLTLGIEGGELSWLDRRYVPYTNLGLALIAPGTTRRNPFMTSHKRIGERHPSMMITHKRPYYLRAIHGLNDSSAHHSGGDNLRAGDVTAALEYFPFLRNHFKPESTASEKVAGGGRNRRLPQITAVPMTAVRAAQ
jgi:hypothetical protein